jgi:hypothetical protein
MTDKHDIARLLKSTMEAVNKVPDEKSKNTEQEDKAMRKRYRSELDNINTSRLAKMRALDFPGRSNFDRLHKSASTARGPKFFSNLEIVDNGGALVLSDKMKFNRLALKGLTLALEKEKKKDDTMSLIGGKAAHGLVLIIRGSRFCERVMSVVRAAGFEEKAKDEVLSLVTTDNDTYNNNDTNNNNTLVLKVEHISRPQSAERTFKENEVHRQLCESVELVQVSPGKYHGFSGSEICPKFVVGSTVLLSKLLQFASKDTRNLKNYSPGLSWHEQVMKEMENTKSDVHYRFTFMSHVDSAISLSEYLTKDRKDRLDARLFVQIEHAILTMWLAGYAHCDFHSNNVLLVITENMTTRPVIIDFGMCIKLEEDHVQKLKTWWAERWQDPDVVGAYDDKSVPSELKRYAVSRMWARGYSHFNWEGNLLQAMARRLSGRGIVRERVAFYRGTK